MDDKTMHQGLPVAGYKPQNDAAIAIVNTNREMEELILRRLDVLGASSGIDKRWLAIGRTGIEQAFMAINRAVFQPERVTLPEDAPPGTGMPD